MLYKEMIAEVKQEIKDLTAAQIEDKKILRKKHDGGTWRTQDRVGSRKIKITSYLVFYNEIKGKKPSHNLEGRYHVVQLEKKYADVLQESEVEKVA